MFINPKLAIEKGWIKFPTWMDENFRNKCIQPNAIDFTIDKVFNVNSRDYFTITEKSKNMRGNIEVEASPQDRLGGELGWHLIDGYGAISICDCLSDFYVELPTGISAMLVPRSTFTRSGLFLTSGLYDSGFKGHIGYVLHNRSGFAYVGKGTRVGQIIFVQSDSAGVYSGGWNHDVGTVAVHQR